MGSGRGLRWGSAFACLVALGCGDDKTTKDGGTHEDASIHDDAGGDGATADAGPTGPETLCSEPYEGTPWQSSDLLAKGPFETGKQTLELIDATRTVPENGTYAGADERKLRTAIWYPASADGVLAEGGPFPLLVWSHGFTSNGEEPSYFAELLASRGYVVAAPTFPLASFGAPGGPTSEDFQNLPGDIRFVIDTMLEKSADENDPFKGAVDPERIAAGGLSMGSSVTLFVSFHANALDERVKATILLAGNGIYYQDAFFATRKLPMLIVHGDIDAVLPYDPCGTSLRERAPSPTWFFTIKKGTHTGFAGYARSLSGNPDRLGCDSIAGANPDRPPTDDTITRLGGEEVGIVIPEEKPTACALDPLPTSITAARQQDLTTQVVYAFLESVFASDKELRNAGCHYLEQGAPDQNDELDIVLR